MEQNNQQPKQFNIEEFTRKSKEYYNKIKPKLESEYKGKYVALDFETENYWIGETATEALTEAKKAFPNKLFYLVQISSPATFSIQSKVIRSILNQNSYGFNWRNR